MSGRTEKKIRLAVRIMLAGTLGEKQETVRVFTRKTKAVHHANPGLLRDFITKWRMSPDNGHPLERIVSNAVVAGRAGELARLNKRAAQRAAQRTANLKASSTTLSGA